MAAIKFDSLDPETQKRILEQLGDQVGDVAPPRWSPVEQKACKTTGTGPGVGGVAPGTRPDPPAEVEDGGQLPELKRPVNRYFIIEHPWAFAWLWGLLMFGCWWGVVWFIELFAGGFVDLGYAGLVIPVGFGFLSWVYFYRKVPGLIRLKVINVSKPIILSVMAVFVAIYIIAFTGGIGVILPTAIAFYLYWCFRWGGDIGSSGGVKSEIKQLSENTILEEPVVSETVEKGPVAPAHPSPSRGISVLGIVMAIGVLFFGVYCIGFGQSCDLNAYTGTSDGIKSSVVDMADTTPPELMIESPRDEITVMARVPEVWFAGRSEPGTVVMLEIEGSTRQLSVNQQGSFGENVNLLVMLEDALRAKAGSLGLPTVPKRTGWHIARLTAIDAAGNKTVKEIRFYFDDPAEKVPEGYYEVRQYPKHKNTFYDLCYFLNYEFSLPCGYKVEEFDCSEMAAMAEWALQTAGFDAYIVVGPAPWDQSGGHAWVLVKTQDKGIVAVEPTVLNYPSWREKDFVSLLWEAFGSAWRQTTGRGKGMVLKNDPYWRNYYYGYHDQFKDIYEAVRMCYDQWNWWEGRWGFK